MPELRSKAKWRFYTCGKCGGEIKFVPSEGRPSVCPQCGWSGGEQAIDDIPDPVRLNLNEI